MLSIPQREGPPITGGPSSLPPLIRAPLRPGTYPHPADDLRLYETHISWVILAGPYAHKSEAVSVDTSGSLKDTVDRAVTLLRGAGD
jgi:hypothetical protein